MQAMAQNHLNSIITTSSGILGGFSKLLTTNILLIAISLQTLLEVAVYASVSALVGYGIKLVVDLVVKFINRKR